MIKRTKIKYVHEGKYVAEVDVELLDDKTEWSPYLSVENAYQLDDVREALRRGDLTAAAKLARICAPASGRFVVINKVGCLP